jgi:3-oxoadipate enol-lactonase
MPVLMRPWGHMHFIDQGSGVPVIFANSLGTDLRMWAEVAAALPCRAIRFDKRGHGLSATPEAPWTVQDLSADVLALMDHLNLPTAIIAGCSVGGMVAQATAIAAPVRVRALILSNSAAKMGTPEAWAARIDALKTGGFVGLVDGVMERWFPAAFRATPDFLPWCTLFLHNDTAGYIGTCQALAAADLRAEVPNITCPTLFLTGTEDLGTPPALIFETAALIPNASVEVIEGVGHIPAVDAPVKTTALITNFLKGLS